MHIPEGITFDDVLLVPQKSAVLPRDCDTRTRFSRRVQINIPVSSAAMDTVTEARLAIALAQGGGIGVIHRNLSVADQAREVDKVKRSANGIILDPVCLPPTDTVRRAKEAMAAHNVSGIPITQGQRLVGILTKRDLRFHENLDTPIAEVMTRQNLVTAPVGTTLDEARDILQEKKVEKLLLTDSQGSLKGMITIRDIHGLLEFPAASRDSRGRLRVGAAVGVGDVERVARLIEAGVDVVVVDTAHGHSARVIETVREIKRQFDIDVVAGNVATAEGAEDLVKAGADGVKVGIGPGSICTTRIVAGIGVPQFTAILDAVGVCDPAGVPVIADGGIRQSGDVTKALAAGASCVMLGSLLAGVDESPGEKLLYMGRTFKSFRGMGSIGAMMKGSAERYGQTPETQRDKLVPEGVEGRVPYRGSLSDLLYQIVGGLRAGMGYCGAPNLEYLRKQAKFIRISHAGLIESHPHDVEITRESSSYLAD